MEENKTKETIKPAEEKKAAAGAKEISLVAMVIAGAWVMLLSLVKAFWGVLGIFWEPLTKINFGLTVSDIVFSGIILAAIFTPVYFSIILDKVKEIKMGG